MDFTKIASFYSKAVFSMQQKTLNFLRKLIKMNKDLNQNPIVGALWYK